MKYAILIALAACVWLSATAAKAGNLLTDNWKVEEGTVSVSPSFAIFGTSAGVIQQSFPTVAGTNYILQFEYKTTGTTGDYLETEVTGSNSKTLVYWSSETTSTLSPGLAPARNGRSPNINWWPAVGHWS